jgi:hypothetical protein
VTKTETERVNDAVNTASFAAANAVYDRAEGYVDYAIVREIEMLAQRVQQTVVSVFCREMNK